MGALESKLRLEVGPGAEGAQRENGGGDGQRWGGRRQGGARRDADEHTGGKGRASGLKHVPAPVNLACLSFALPTGTEEQKHLQFSAISRHFKATKWRLCVDGIVAVDPRERTKGCSRLPGGASAVSWAFWLNGA